MKKYKKSYSPNMIFGINGSLNVLKAKKLEIISIHIMIDSNADSVVSVAEVPSHFNPDWQLKIEKSRSPSISSDLSCRN